MRATSSAHHDQDGRGEAAAGPGTAAWWRDCVCSCSPRYWHLPAIRLRSASAATSCRSSRRTACSATGRTPRRERPTCGWTSRRAPCGRRSRSSCRARAAESELIRRVESDDAGGGHAAAEVGPQADEPAEGDAQAVDRPGGEVGQALGVRAAPSDPSCPGSRTRPGRGTRSIASSWRGWRQEGLKPSPEADRATLIRRLEPRPDGLAADARRGRRVRVQLSLRGPTRSWSTGCWPRPTTASGWRWTGSTRPATPTPTATRTTSPGRCGPGATGSSTRSTATSRSTGS